MPRRHAGIAARQRGVSPPHPDPRSGGAPSIHAHPPRDGGVCAWAVVGLI